MEYALVAGAALLLAWSFPYWEPTRRTSIGAVGLAVCLTGTVAHLAGTAIIGWTSGPLPAAGAFLVIPAAASVVYSLLISPISRARRLRRGGPQIGIAALHTARQR